MLSFPVPGTSPARAGAATAWMLLCAVLLSACGPGTRPADMGIVDAGARAHVEAGRYEEAAGEYLRLAELYPKSSTGLKLDAAEAYLAAGNPQSALAIVQSVTVTRRQAADAARRQVLLAEIALLQQHPEDALQLSAQVPAAIPDALRVRRHALRARAHDALGDVAGAAIERSALLEANPPDPLREGTLRALWSGLSALDGAALQKLVASGNAAIAGWAELAQLAGGLRDQRDELELAVREWEAAHPGHPAVPGITGEILTAFRLIDGARGHVALLLPMSGQFARAAAAVRDGFLVQMYLSGRRPRVTILDTTTGNVLERHAEAVAAGAQFIIGPLEKEAVTRLATRPVSVPTLALNQETQTTAAAPDASAPASPGRDPLLFTFSLAPEDEAADAARRARDDGHHRALVVTPDSDWGARLAAAFTASWEAGGGTVLEHVRYQPESTDYAALTREIFNLDSSQLRTAMLRQDLGIAVHGSARKRRDADMIFMPAPPAAARQVMPHFRYFGADRVPVYSTAAVFSGTPNPRLDHDIDGVRFPDIPWVAAADASTFQQLLDREFSSSLAGLRRLYAFGADAWLIMSRLGEVSSRPGLRLAGETGELFMTRDGQFRRRLSWAEFRGGIPVALGTAAGE